MSALSALEDAAEHELMSVPTGRGTGRWSDMEIREVQYARGGGSAIAFSIAGDGPLDLVYVPGYVSHVEYVWDGERSARFLRRLASFSGLTF
jgi:hypothetical protein